jgi:CRP/FNR family cyclic AMP-dependent transcriptional regulator
MMPSRVHPTKEPLEQLQKNLSVWSIRPDLVELLQDRHVIVPFERGAIVFGEGSMDDFIGCVTSGYVRVNCLVGDGNRTPIRLAGPGELIGYSNYMDSSGRRARLFESEAFSKCSVAFISRDLIARHLRQLDSDSLVHILECLNSFWALTMRWFATLLGLPFRNRLELVLSDLALRAGIKDSRGTILIPQLAHEDLAEMIGSSRPMVTRMISRMIETGLLECRSKQCILLKKWDFEPYLPLLRSLTPGDLVHPDGNGKGAKSPLYNRDLSAPRHQRRHWVDVN